MALTRKLLKSMGLTDEQIDSVIEAHSETVEGLKTQISNLKADADKLADIQKELDEANARKDYKEDYEKAVQDLDAYKAKYDKAAKDLADYKAEVAGKERLAAVKAAYKKLLAEKKVGDKYQDSVMNATDFSGMELDEGGALKDVDALKKDIDAKWSGFVVTTRKEGAHVDTPPANNNGKMSKDEIMQIKDAGERQKAIAENLDLFGYQ